MSQVNLLPPEIRQRQVTRRTSALVALGGLAVLAVLGFFYFLQTMSLSRVNEDLRAQEAINAQKQAEIQSLSEFAELQTEVQAKRTLVDTVFANEVAWSGVLLDLSRILPGPAYLTNVTGVLTVPTGVSETPAPSPGGPTDLIGDIELQGFALDTGTIAMWLTRLEQVEGWVNPWLATAAEDEPGSNRYGFTSGVDLSTAASTERGRGGQP